MRNKNARIPDPAKIYTDPGSPINILYDAKVMPDGTIKLEEAGTENIQDKIEACRSTTDMSYIIHRLQIGNTDVITVNNGQYGDFTKVPKSMAEALQIQIDAEKAWYGMPVEVRSKFDNDFTKWLVTAGSEEWTSKMFPSDDNSGVALVAEGDVKE